MLMLSVMESGAMASSRNKSFDGAPCAGKLACTVRSGGKSGAAIKTQQRITYHYTWVLKNHMTKPVGNLFNNENLGMMLIELRPEFS